VTVEEKEELDAYVVLEALCGWLKVRHGKIGIEPGLYQPLPGAFLPPSFCQKTFFVIFCEIV